MTKEERLILIKFYAEKANKAKRKKALKAKSVKAMVAAKKPTRARKTVEELFGEVDESVNINAWTDASKYADEYYGETYRETTRFDDEWN